MKKQILAIILVLLLVGAILSLYACGDNQALSAYDIAVENGFIGTEAEWIISLKGESAYQSAVNNGYIGTEEEWLQGLQGIDGEYAGRGLSSYEIAVENGFIGSESEWLISLKGDTGDAASSAAYAANLAVNSVVSVYCEFTGTQQVFPSSEPQEYNFSSAGAGVIYRDDKQAGDAYIITNYHVVYSADSNNGVSENIKVYLYGMEMEQYAITAQFVGGSLTYDIAVLKLSESALYRDSSSRAAVMASREVYAGETAIAIGNPEASGISSTVGVVSVDSEYLTMTGADEITEVTFRVMRIDTAVNGGNSGGGLFNDQGQLIGIVNAKIIKDNIENIGYAIPANAAMFAAENMIRNCEGSENKSIERCLVGIQLEIMESSAYYNELTGFTEIRQIIGIGDVVEGGVADGKLMEGDIVNSFTYNSVTLDVNRIFTIVDYSLNFVTGETLVMNVERQGVAQDISITLGDFTVIP